MGYAFASVVETVQLNKRLRRIALEVPELDRLQLPKAGDAAVGIYFYFPDANRPKRPPPMDCRDGVWGYYDATTAPPGRTYSIRNHDPVANRINVDVVLHGHGVGSTWAQTAALASEVVVAHACTITTSRVFFLFRWPPRKCTAAQGIGVWQGAGQRPRHRPGPGADVLRGHPTL